MKRTSLVTNYERTHW